MVAVALRHTFQQPSDQSRRAVIWGQEVGGRGSPTTFCVVRFSMNEGVAVARAHRKWTTARDESGPVFPTRSFFLVVSVEKFRVEVNVSSCSEETRLLQRKVGHTRLVGELPESTFWNLHIELIPTFFKILLPCFQLNAILSWDSVKSFHVSRLLVSGLLSRH